MALYLQHNVRLSIEGSNILLRRDGVPVSHSLGVAEAVALTFLAASGEVHSTAEACRGCLPNGDYWVNRVVNRFWTYLGGEAPRPIELDWLAAISRSRPAFPILPSSHVKQEPAPASITWMVTLGCNRHCPYCFFDVFEHSTERKESPKDATFPFDDAARMIREMALLGAADLYLTGGEPLLRNDLVDLLKQADRVRVRTHITTKYPIQRPLAQELSKAGLTSITVSLDDARPRQAAGLAGARNYLAEATEALRALLETSIAIEVNAVATQVNADGLEVLAGYLAGLGVPRLKISAFNEPYPFRPSARHFTTPTQLSDRVSRIREKYEGRLEVELDGEDSSTGALRLSCVDHAVCEIGTRSLHVLPDGSASRCRYLPDMREMVIGSLQKSTLLEIWNSAELNSLARPERESFAGTSCFDCGSHEACNSRGRCYVASLTSAGHLYAPDSFCSRSAT